MVKGLRFRSMKYFESFAGVGGFSVGIHNACANADSSIKPVCVGFSEVDKYASAVLKYRFPETKNYGDISKIQWDSVPDFDMLVGGSPCQSFSMAGKRAGFEGASGLFWEYIRCLKEKKPQYFLWENVKGVLSSNHGYDFANIVNSFSEAGYSLWWQILNAKDFGVPQNRERIFVFGTRSDIGSPREVFFERKDDGVHSEQNATKKLSPNANTLFFVHNVYGGFKEKRARMFYDACPTLRTPKGGGHVPNLTDGHKVRRLMSIEAERLMSWADGWTSKGINDKGEEFEVSDIQRYKMCGNGVVSKVVEEIVKVHLL